MQNRKFKNREFINEELNKKPQVYTFIMHTALGFDCEINKECYSDEEYAAFSAKLMHHVIMNTLFHNPNSPIVKSVKEKN